MDADGGYQDELPKYRDMMRRVAQDPVSQTVMFELLIRLFLQVVLNVRPETLACRRQSSRKRAREWCTDGVAAASTGAGMLGPVLAFRGEVEAQGRVSLHPHVLVWLLCKHLQAISSVLLLLEQRPRRPERGRLALVLGADIRTRVGGARKVRRSAYRYYCRCRRARTCCCSSWW